MALRGVREHEDRKIPVGFQLFQCFHQLKGRRDADICRRHVCQIVDDYYIEFVPIDVLVNRIDYKGAHCFVGGRQIVVPGYLRAA